MKIIKTDNFNRDHIPESVYASGLTREEAKKECDRLNSIGSVYSPDFYEVKPEDYKHITIEDIYGW